MTKDSASVPRQIEQADAQGIREKLLAWFDAERRDLPWRADREAYTTWISEVMLQQTRVDQMLPYYERFVGRYPNVESLASADRDDVLKSWEGLGYYARARNLHRAASIVAEQGFPKDRDEWLALPGVGPYISAAVASIMNAEPVAAVDGNVERVVSRLFIIADQKGSPAFRRRVRDTAEQLLHTGRPGDFNEAMMDLGATVCRPRTPACGECPIRSFCRAAARDKQTDFPVRKKTKAVPHHREVVVVMCNESGDLLLRQRPEDGLLGGLWELPGTRVGPLAQERQELEDHLDAALPWASAVSAAAGEIKHAYTHFRVTVAAYVGRPHGHLSAGGFNLPEQYCWANANELEALALPRAHRKLLAEIDLQGT